MPDNGNLKFIPQEHTDYIFRVESENRVLRFLGWLVTPLALLVIRGWFWLKHRRF